MPTLVELECGISTGAPRLENDSCCREGLTRVAMRTILGLSGSSREGVYSNAVSGEVGVLEGTLETVFADGVLCGAGRVGLGLRARINPEPGEVTGDA